MLFKSLIEEKIIHKIISHGLEEINFLLKHQFRFSSKNSTIKQVWCFSPQKYWSAVFLDISQTFDKVWHNGLFYKLKKIFPYNYYRLIKEYLIEWKFLITKKLWCAKQHFKRKFYEVLYSNFFFYAAFRFDRLLIDIWYTFIIRIYLVVIIYFNLMQLCSFLLENIFLKSKSKGKIKIISYLL